MWDIPPLNCCCNLGSLSFTAQRDFRLRNLNFTKPGGQMTLHLDESCFPQLPVCQVQKAANRKDVLVAARHNPTSPWAVTVNSSLWSRSFWVSHFAGIFLMKVPLLPSHLHPSFIGLIHLVSLRKLHLLLISHKNIDNWPNLLWENGYRPHNIQSHRGI